MIPLRDYRIEQVVTYNYVDFVLQRDSIYQEKKHYKPFIDIKFEGKALSVLVSVITRILPFPFTNTFNSPSYEARVLIFNFPTISLSTFSSLILLRIDKIPLFLIFSICCL